jgi:hypothetical protein
MTKNIGRQNIILVVNEVEEHELKGSSCFLLEKGEGVEIYFFVLNVFLHMKFPMGSQHVPHILNVFLNIAFQMHISPTINHLINALLQIININET